MDLGRINRAKTSMGYKSNESDIENDAMEPEVFVEFLTSAFQNANDVMKPGASFYSWSATASEAEFLAALYNAGLEWHQTLIWVKQQLVLTMSDYQHRYEPCLYGWKPGAAHYFIDLRSQDTVFNITNINNLSLDELKELYKDLTSYTDAPIEDRPSRSAEHPTMKPLALIKKQVRNSSREGENVLDLFGGSGTTLLACEELNRTCYMMEYDPKYCDVIIDRWEEMTGEQAVKKEDAKWEDLK